MNLERHDEVALLRLRGGKANAMTADFLDRLLALMGEAEASDARAVVLTGYDAFFSAGLALPTLIDLDRRTMGQAIDRFSRAMQRVFTFPRPVVAAVNGHAIAGGCVLALQADVRLMVEGTAKIGLNETALGIGLPASVIEPLRGLLSPPALVPVALEGKLFGPAEAARIGLVDELVPAATLESRALARARDLGRIPAAGFAQVKASLRRPGIETMEREGARDRDRWLDTWFSPPAQERLRQAVARLGGTKGQPA